MSEQSKSKYWTFVGYPESMIPNWQVEVGGLLQYPYCYCVHDKDVIKETGEVKEHRKAHVHFIIAFNNTTTYNHALKVAKQLGAINTVEPCINVRHCYDYLIHDTEDAKAKNKYQYSKEERICGNNFDIGSYEQISTAEKTAITKELMALACSGQFYNFFDFTEYVIGHYEDKYINEFISHQSLLNNIVKGNYHKWEMNEKQKAKEAKLTPLAQRQIGEHNEVDLDNKAIIKKGE